jgi:hypothetical protein
MSSDSKRALTHMTYANSRLRLGIFGVGSIVVISVVSITSRFPYALFSTSDQWSLADFSSLGMLVAVFTAMMLPLDILGGFVLPKLFGRQNISTLRASNVAALKIAGTNSHRDFVM